MKIRVRFYIIILTAVSTNAVNIIMKNIDVNRKGQFCM